MLLAAAGAATLFFAGCGDDVQQQPSGNLMAAPYDAAGVDESITVDLGVDGGPSGNLLTSPFDMSTED